MDPRRREAKEWERHAAYSFEGTYPGLRVSWAPDQYAVVDAVITNVETREVVSFLEVKSRDGLTKRKLQQEFANEWLISKDKVDALAALSRMFKVDGVGWLILTDENVMLMRKLTDGKTGKPCAGIRFAQSQTQSECTDKTPVVRWNSYASMANARSLGLLPFRA